MNMFQRAFELCGPGSVRLFGWIGELEGAPGTGSLGENTRNRSSATFDPLPFAAAAAPNVRETKAPSRRRG
jgi:hypothetical protein